MKKKLAGIISLVMVMAMLLTACGNTKTPGETAKDPGDNKVSDNNSTDSKDETPDETPEESADSKVEMSRGIWEGNTYTSEYASVTFTMPEDWVYGSDEEIAATMNIGAHIVSEGGTKFSSEMLAQQSIYDMMARNISTGSNVSLMYENLSVVIGGSKLTADDYIDALKQQLEALGDTYGYTFDDTIRDETLSGETYRTLDFEMSSYGVKQTCFVRKVDNYMLCIIVSTTGDDDVKDIVACFS